MRFFVKAEVFESIVRDDDIARARHALGKKAKQIRESGKLIEGGALADGRGGVFIIDVDSEKELFSLLAPELVDHCRLEVRPLVAVDELSELFRKQGAA